MVDASKNKKNRGLGRGLGALLSDKTADVVSSASNAVPTSAEPVSLAPESSGERLLMLDPAEIRPNPRQPRRIFNEAALAELADSLKKDGVQEPVIVRRRDEEYQIVCGERRCRAAVMAGLERIPAICREVADGDMLKFGLIENIQREDLNAIELAIAYKELMEEYAWTQEQTAEAVGKKRATVSNILRLLQLPEVIQEQVADGALTMGHARAILAMPDAAAQLALARKIIARGLSVRQAEQLAAAGAGKAPRKERGVAAKPPHILQLEDALRRRLGAKVSLKQQDAQRGRIEIEYFSLDELERLLDIINNR